MVKPKHEVSLKRKSSSALFKKRKFRGKKIYENIYNLTVAVFTVKINIGFARVLKNSNCKLWTF